MTEYDVTVSDERCLVKAEQHAFSTGWAFDPESKTYVLTLLDMFGEVMAAATYTFDNWMDVFERLKAAHVATTARTAYRDDSFSERTCDKCGKRYRGPAVYCSLECAEADA